jgi:hypothetical protein
VCELTVCAECCLVGCVCLASNFEGANAQVFDPKKKERRMLVFP